MTVKTALVSLDFSERERLLVTSALTLARAAVVSDFTADDTAAADYENAHRDLIRGNPLNPDSVSAIRGALDLYLMLSDGFTDLVPPPTEEDKRVILAMMDAMDAIF